MESFGQSGITLQAVLQIVLRKRLVRPETQLPHIVFECVPIASAVAVSIYGNIAKAMRVEFIYMCAYV